MMSAPLPDCTAAVMRGCRSLALMNSKVTSAPSALLASGACRLSSTSASGMKSTHRTMCSLLACAKAGARPAAVSATTAPVPCRNVRRLIADVVIGLPLVDLLQLALGPLHGVLGLGALHGLGVHVDDDVLRVGLGRLGRRRSRMAEGPRLARRLPEHLQRLVDPGPHWMLFPLLGGADAVALVHLEPLAVVRVLVQPFQEVLRELLVLAVLHDRVLLAAVERELAGRARGHQRRVLDVLDDRFAFFVLDLVLLALGDDVDRGAVQRRGDLAGVERAVVVGVVPREAALVAGVLPEGLHELHGFDAALAVDRHLLAGLVDLGAPEVPQQRIGEGRRVAEAVPEGLPDGLALGLELLADLAILVPRPRELLHADLVEPGAPVCDRVADDGVGH